MNCPICKHKTQVIDSRLNGNRVKRTRECLDCLTRFNTFEGLDFNSLPEYLKGSATRNGLQTLLRKTTSKTSGENTF